MNTEVKSGREMLEEFFSEIKSMQGVKKDVIEVVSRLFDEDKLTNTNLTNELEELRKKEING